MDVLKLGENSEQVQQQLLKLSKTSQDVGLNIAASKKPVAEMSKGFLDASKSIDKTTVAAKSATVGMKLLSMAGNMIIFWAVSEAITAVVKTLDNYVHKNEIAIKKSNELLAAWKEQQDSLKSNKETIDSISNEYEKLAQGVDQFGNKISLTAEEYKRYNEIVNKIAEMFPTMVTGYTLEGNAILSTKGNVEALTKAYEEQAKAARDALLIDGGNIFSGVKAEVEELDKKIKASEAAQWLLNGGDANDSPFGSNVISEAEKILKAQGIVRQMQVYANGSHDMTYGLIQHFDKKTGQYDDALPEDVSKRTQQRNDIEREYNLLISQRDGILSKTNTVMQAFLQNNSTFAAQTQEVQQYVSSMASLLNPAEFNYDDDVMKAYIQTSWLQPINENKDSVQEALAGLFTLDSSQMSAQAWADQAKDLVDKVAHALNLSDNQKQKLMIRVGIEFVDGNEISVDKMISEISSKLNISADDIGKLGIDDLKSAYTNLADLGCKSIDELIAKLDNLKSANQTSVPSISTKELEDARKATDTLVSSAKALSSAFEEQRETGRLSAETILGIVDAGYAAALQIDQETGAVTINQQAYLALAQAKIQEQIASLQTDRAALVAELETEKAAALNLAGAYLEEAKAKMIAKQDSVDSIDAQIRALDTVKSNLGSVVTGYYHVGNAAKQAADEMKKAFQSAQSAINTLLDMTMKMVKQRYDDEKDRLQDQLDDLKDRYDAEKDDLEEVNKEKEYQYKRDREAIENQQNALKAELDSRLEMLRLKKEEYYWDKDTKENNKTISELESEYAIAKNDDSLEGIARQKDLEEQLAKAKEEWKDKQFDHDLEQQEDALQKEFDLADEKYQNELDDLERVEEQRKADHQAELDRIEDEYEADREYYERKIEKIEETTSKEGLIRAEAIKLIESKNKDFYNRLMQWNLTYGDGLSSTLEIAWANGYAALETYNNGQLNVLATLNELALKMNEFESATNRAVAAVSNLNSSKSKLQSELNSLLKYNDKANGRYDDRISEIQDQLRDLDYYDKGGVDTTGGLKRMHGTAQSPEVIFNAIDANKLYNFIHNTPDIGSIIARQMNERINAMNPFNRMNMAAPPAFAGDITVNQGDVIVQGGMDKAALSGIKQALKDNSKLLKDLVCDEIMKKQYLRGHGNMTY